MPIIRYSRNSSGSLKRENTDVFKRSAFDDSVVDKSSFRPNVNDVHNFTGGSSGMVPLYEFPDGKDNGLRLGAIRSLGADIAEIDATRNALENSIEEQKIEYDKAVADEIKATKERLKAQKEKSKVVETVPSIDNGSDV